MKIDFHVHPYFEKYCADEIVKAMYSRDINIIGLAGFNQDTFDIVRKEFDRLKKPFKVENDSLIIKINNEKNSERYILRIGEYANKEGFHLLVFGDQKKVRFNEKVRKNIDSALSTDSFVILDHPFVAPNYADITKEKEDSLFRLCEEYNGKIALEWNGYCIPSLRNLIDKVFCSPLRLAKYKNIRFGDVNKKLEDFEKSLKENSINCPIIADTDMHARRKKDLNLLGISNIEVEVAKESGIALRKSLKEKVFDFEYKINKGYVPYSHFFPSYAFPTMISQFGRKLKRKIRSRG